MSELKEFQQSAALSKEREALQAKEVGGDIVAAALQRGKFVLRSGESSSFYFDKYLFETKPTILRRLAQMFAERVPEGVDRLAATDGGAVALATAASLATGLPFVIIMRDDSAAPVRGELYRGETVALIQDVVDSGGQAVDAARQIGHLGAKVAGIISVVDRQAGGAASIAEAGFHYEALFTLSDLNI